MAFAGSGDGFTGLEVVCTLFGRICTVRGRIYVAGEAAVALWKSIYTLSAEAVMP
jgi:hypothetical protein